MRPYSIFLAVWLGTGVLLSAPADALRVLKIECFGCHNPEKRKGGLDLTSHDAVLRGGDSGSVISGRLWNVLAPDADPHMPPKKQLADWQITAIRDWAAAGATWDPAALAESPVLLTSLPESYRPTFAIASTSNRLSFARGGMLSVYELAATNALLLAKVDAHLDAVQALAFSADGKRLASAAFRRVSVWDPDTLKPLLHITNDVAGMVTALAYAPTGLVIAMNGELQIIDPTEGRRLAAWRGHSDTIYDLDVSRDGKRLASAGGDRLVKIWDIETRKEIAALEGHAAQVLSAAFNSNAAQVVSSAADHVLKVWDITTRETIATLGQHKQSVVGVAWPVDSSVVYAARADGTLLSYRNLKRHSGEQSSGSGDERRVSQTTNVFTAISVNVDGAHLFTGSQDGSVIWWNSEGKRMWEAAAPIRHISGKVQAAVPKLGREAETSLMSVSKVNVPRHAQVIKLLADPPELRLGRGEAQARFLISAQLADGRVIDVTTRARYEDNFARTFQVLPTLRVKARAPGTGELIAHYEGQRVNIPVRVSSVGDPSNPTFVRDILPVLSKAGCNAGACHAKADGQNGFRLSVFSYDPKADYEEIVQEVRGRRVFPAAPDESLLIKKPTAGVPHEGGRRFELGSETHELLVSWIREGMPYTDTNEPALVRVETFPKSRRYFKGAVQPLIVLAHYSDGSVRDVTHLAAFESNDKEIVKVSDLGVMALGAQPGQAVVVARYMGRMADAQVAIPSDRVLPKGAFARVPRYNFIDDLAYGHFQRAGLFPSELSTDAEFLRRAKLDALGLLPTPDEVRGFLTDTAPDKRRRLVTRILDDPAYADYWANKWADLVRPNSDRVGVKSVFTLDQWLRSSFRENKPYDQFVREILLADGINHRDGPAVIYRDRREPPELATMFSQLFLGTRMECAKCHHHPNEKWSQEDFYQFAAFFGSVKRKGAGLSPPISAGRETFYFAPGGKVKHPVTDETMIPKPLDAAVASYDDAVDPRRVLGDWLTSSENPFFAKAAVNRVWANFFGRGLVEPVDDFRISNPCVNPELLDALARNFVEKRYDLKQLMRTIMESRLYQLSSRPNASNLADTKSFSRSYRRRLPAEVLLDAVNDATGMSSSFSAMPVGARAIQTWSFKIDSHFMDAFGRPNSSSDCPCERDTHLSVVQSLHLMNAKDIQAKLANQNGRARQLADSSRSPRDIVEELYLATVSRFPNSEELDVALRAFNAEGATRRTATEDVFWALLNSAEFVLNH